MVISNQNLREQEPSGYDAQAIAKYYRKRPWLVLWRTVQLVWLFGNFLLRLQWDQWTNHKKLSATKRPQELRQILTKLGPTFIKVGQALSTRPDLIRRDFLDELIKLQDQLPPFDNYIAFNIIETQLGCSIDEAYRERFHPIQ